MRDRRDDDDDDDCMKWYTRLSGHDRTAAAIELR